MPHGDLSDMTAFFCAATGLTSIFKPEMWFKEFGPVQPAFDVAPTPELLAAMKFAGGLLMFMFPVLYVVRWNTLNGKAAALGCLIAAATSAHIALTMDNFAFRMRPWYIFSFMMFVGAMHLSFNANPMLTSAMLLEKEKAKAAKAAAKAK